MSAIAPTTAVVSAGLGAHEIPGSDTVPGVGASIGVVDLGTARSSGESAGASIGVAALGTARSSGERVGAGVVARDTARSSGPTD
jgi:hypothetical protein